MGSLLWITLDGLNTDILGDKEEARLLIINYGFDLILESSIFILISSAALDDFSH